MHSFLTFVSANGMLVKEAVQIALFFAHQCNGTVMFTEAMKRLTITHRPEVTQARKDDTSRMTHQCIFFLVKFVWKLVVEVMRI